MQVPRRFDSLEDYRYGFQGQEKDDEVKGEGNSLNYTFRMHDPRVGRFFAVDPLEIKYPWYTPYQFSGNRLIDAIELEGLEEKIVHTQYYENKIYTTVLKRSQFTYVEWKQIQKIWWRSIILDAKVNEQTFGGVGFNEYYYALHNRPKPAFDTKKNTWNGFETGTLYVTDYHGQMVYGFDKNKADGGSEKMATNTLDILLDGISNVEYGASGSIVATGGASSVVAIPLMKLTEAIGKIATIEKAVIQTVNGDIGEAIKTGTGGIIIPPGVKKIFDKWRAKVPSRKGIDKINFIEKLVNDAISKGLDKVNIPIENKPKTTVKNNTSGF